MAKKRIRLSDGILLLSNSEIQPPKSDRYTLRFVPLSPSLRYLPISTPFFPYISLSSLRIDESRSGLQGRKRYPCPSFSISLFPDSKSNFNDHSRFFTYRNLFEIGSNSPFSISTFVDSKQRKVWRKREREGFDERVSKRMINYHGKGRDERVSLASLTRYRRWFRQNYFSYGDLRERYCFLLDNLLFLSIFEQVGVSYNAFFIV